MAKYKYALLLSLLLTIIPLFLYWTTFSNPTNINYYEKLYSGSQYVVGEASTHKIDDNEVYIYAGYTYIRGDDPTLVNFEHTPLAKYFLGLSYLITGNSVLLNLPLYFLTLVLLFVLSNRVIKDTLISYGILIVIGIQKLFYFNVSQGMLDIPNLFASLLFFVILTGNFKSPVKKYLLLGVSLGVFAGTRYPFPLILLLIVPLIIWAIFEKQIKYLILSAFGLIAIYFLTYAVYFKTHTLFDWVRFEWYRFIWFAGNRTIPKFLIFQTIFLGKFMGWWDNKWQLVDTWSILWPTLFVGSIIGTIKNKLDLKNSVLLLHTFGLIAYYSITAASYDRFLISLIPYWAIIFGIGIDNWKAKSNFFGEVRKALKTK